MAKGREINVWTDSKHAYGIVHAHRAIWREGELLTAQEKMVKYAAEILRLPEAVELPLQVATVHC